MIGSDDKRLCFVGFDTSNYTTSVAVCTENGEVVANLKAPLPVKDGQRGLRQSDAVFEHVRNLPALCELLSKTIERESLTVRALGVSVTPRDAEGSYMPCFLSGKAAAYSYASALNVPVYEFSHQNGHVMAAAYSSGFIHRINEGPFVAFHVSGGTTESLYVVPKKDGISVTTVGETDDINAGQLIDRVGVAMGLKFPAGAQMEQYAASYNGKIYKHPVCVRNGRCSLSGAENIALRLYRETNDRSAVAAFVFDFVERTLSEMAEEMEKIYGRTPVLFAGGVMSNRLMRESLSKRFDAYFSAPEFSADNAAGIALLCREKYIG